MQPLYIGRLALVILLMAVAVVLVQRQSETASNTVVEKKGPGVFIVDQTGERWDIRQAVSIGFEPRHFEFGIGRHAFVPLDDTDWQDTPPEESEQMRVIGITGHGEAHAYSVRKLRSHETANTHLGAEPVVAGY